MSTIFRNEPPEPVTVDGAIEEMPPAPPKTDRQKQIALYAFVGLFVAVIGSSVGYLASRRGAATSVPPPALAVQQSAAVVVPAPESNPISTAATPPTQPAPTPATQPQSTDVKPAVQPPQASGSPAAPGTSPKAATSENPAAAVKPAPPVVTAAAPPQVLSPLPPRTSPLAGELEQPEANRLYLQVGSLEKGVAEVLAQGLRIRGMQATVAPGVTQIVSRIIVGPFETSAEMEAVNKHLNGLGFRPFPRRFAPDELRKLLSSATPANPAMPPQDVRR